MHEPVQSHILEHSCVEEITNPRRLLRRLGSWFSWKSAVHDSYIPIRVLEQKTFAYICVGVSCCLPAYYGFMDESSLIDQDFLKALAVLIGLLISFRSTRPNERRTEAYMLVEDLCDAARDLIDLLPPTGHREAREEAKHILRCVIFHVTR